MQQFPSGATFGNSREGIWLGLGLIVLLGSKGFSGSMSLKKPGPSKSCERRIALALGIRYDDYVCLPYSDDSMTSDFVLVDKTGSSKMAWQR